jgi:glycosyltransferase involved in cell wall biosynthesis
VRRILLFTPGHLEPGGAQRRSRLLAEGLAERGWDVRVLSRAGTIDRFRLTRSSNLHVVEVPGFGRRRLGAVIYAACSIPLSLVWGKHATCAVGIQLSSPSLMAAAWAWVFRRPFIAMTTLTGTQSDVSHVLTAPLTVLRQALLDRAAFFVAQTAEGAAELQALAPPERIAVIPSPLVPVDATPLNGRPRAVFSGRLAEEKDLQRLLRVWLEFAGDRVDAMLTLIGEGGHYRGVEDELRSLVASDAVLARTVRFTGWVPDVAPYLREADVYVFPSLREGMSNALLEACAHHRIIVASDIPANRAVLGDDYPLLFRAGDSGQLATALNRAFDDEAVRHEALARLVPRLAAFTVDSVVDRLEALVHDANRARS